MNEKITLQDLINLFATKQGMNKKDAELFIRTMFDLIEETLATEKYIKIKGLGTFKLTEVDSRESVNVNTGERIEIQGHTKISFTPDTSMKDLINKPFAHFETVILNEGVELEDTITEDMDTPEETVIENPVIEEVPIKDIPKPEVIEEIPETKEISENIEIPEPIVETIEASEISPEKSTEEINEIEQPEFLKAIKEEPINAEEKQEKNTNRILWGIIVTLVLIILMGAYWMFLRTSNDSKPISTPSVLEEVIKPSPEIEEKTQEETLKLVQFIELSTEELRKERVPSLADTLEYQIVGTETEYTLKNGETIIRASIKFFGTKKYWPYIVKHNIDILKDPDNIPAGVQLKIPKLVERQ